MAKRQAGKAGGKPSVWIVDDNPRSLQEIREALRHLNLEISELDTQAEFDAAFGELQADRARPDVVILDLTLLWDGPLKHDAAADPRGIDCLARLRREEATRDAAVVIYSAFIEGDEVIRNRLAEFGGGITLVSKPDTVQLRVRVENLLPQASETMFSRLLRIGRTVEGSVLRLNAFVRAVGGLVLLIGAVGIVVVFVLNLLRLL